MDPDAFPCLFFLTLTTSARGTEVHDGWHVRDAEGFAALKAEVPPAVAALLEKAGCPLDFQLGLCRVPADE